MYGTALPDWLDEAIAISCENKAETDRRLSDLRRAQTAPATISLASFFEKQHPRTSRQFENDKKTVSKTKNEVTVTVGIRDIGGISPTGTFYSQAHGVAQFLREVSGKSDILGQIAREFMNGSDPQAAVLNSLKRDGKPPSIDELDLLWTRWLAGNAAREASN